MTEHERLTIDLLQSNQNQRMTKLKEILDRVVALIEKQMGVPDAN